MRTSTFNIKIVVKLEGFVDKYLQSYDNIYAINIAPVRAGYCP